VTEPIIGAVWKENHWNASKD